MLQSLLYNLTSFTPLQELRRAQMQSRSGSTFGRVLSYDGVEIFREHNFVLMHFLHRRRPWIMSLETVTRPMYGPHVNMRISSVHLSIAAF